MEKNVVVNVVGDDPAELTNAEKTRLKELENVIERNTKGVFEWGIALMEIRGKRLYRERYATFEDYVRERWDMGRSYASRLIGAGQVYERLLPIGNILPVCEAQVRPLLKVAPSMQPKVWQEAAKTAPGGRVTARLVSRVVSRIVGPTPKKQPKPRPAAADSLMDAWNERITWMIDEAERANKQGWDEEVKSSVPSVLRYILSLIEGS